MSSGADFWEWCQLIVFKVHCVIQYFLYLKEILCLSTDMMKTHLCVLVFLKHTILNADICIFKPFKLYCNQFNSMWAVNFQMFKLELQKAAESEIKLPTSIESSRKQESSRNIYFCFMDYPKTFDYVDHNKLWNILKEWEYQTTWPVSWEISKQVKKNRGNWTWNRRLVPNWERSMSRLFMLTLFI